MDKHRAQYNRARMQDKMLMEGEIVAALRHCSWSGRFLKRIGMSWKIMTDSEAREKVSHMLQETKTQPRQQSKLHMKRKNRQSTSTTTEGPSQNKMRALIEVVNMEFEQLLEEDQEQMSTVDYVPLPNYDYVPMEFAYTIGYTPLRSRAHSELMAAIFDQLPESAQSIFLNSLLKAERSPSMGL